MKTVESQFEKGESSRLSDHDDRVLSLHGEKGITYSRQEMGKIQSDAVYYIMLRNTVYVL